MARDPRDTSAAEPDGGNLHVRIQGGPGLGNRPGLLNRTLTARTARTAGRAWARGMVPGMLVLIVSACATHEHSHEDHGAQPREAAVERPTIAVTRWTDRSELFMEYPALVAGESGRFAIHVTDLSDFLPLTAGEAVVLLRGENGIMEEFRGGISRPGIFGADVRPTSAGVFAMSLRVESPDLKDVHELGSVTVHGSGALFPSDAEEAGEGITFLKEQQWTLEFRTEAVVERNLQPSLLVPGSVRPRAGGDAVLSAPVSGRVDPLSGVPVPGARVRAGSVIARIVPRSDAIRDEAGLRAALVDAEQRFELARQERDRAERLVASRAVPARRLSEAEAALTASKAGLDAATQRIDQLALLSQSGEPARGDHGFVIRAPFDGVVAEVRIVGGASIEEGDPLLRVVDDDMVHVVGAVPESRVDMLKTLGAAEFVIDDGRERAPVPLGRAIAVGSVVEPDTRTVDVRYELDNRNMKIPVGRGVRLRLFVGDPERRPAVPASAIVDDGGRPVVFVQAGGESFERRDVRLGSREGNYVHVLEGIETGERVVSRGAYLIRLAAMSSSIPAHGHVH